MSRTRTYPHLGNDINAEFGAAKDLGVAALTPVPAHSGSPPFPSLHKSSTSVLTGPSTTGRLTATTDFTDTSTLLVRSPPVPGMCGPPFLSRVSAVLVAGTR